MNRTEQSRIRRALWITLMTLTPLVIADCGPGPGSESPALVLSAVAPAEGARLWPVYEDDAVRMVQVGCGMEERRSEPGFYVYRKAEKEWVRVDAVSTEGGVFGRAPTFEEANKLGRNPPSLSWNHSSLADEDHLPLPLDDEGCLFLPDKVVLDTEVGHYLLHYATHWGIPETVTMLRLPVDELLSAEPEALRGSAARLPE